MVCSAAVAVFDSESKPFPDRRKYMWDRTFLCYVQHCSVVTVSCFLFSSAVFKENIEVLS